VAVRRASGSGLRGILAPMTAGAQRLFARAGSDAAWQPGEDLLRDSRLARFLRSVEMTDLDRLQARAVADPAWFWSAAVDDLALDWQRPAREVLDVSRGIPWPRWWTGGAFNWAAAAVAPRGDADDALAAVTWEGEDGEVRTLSRGELRAAVDRAAAALAANGVGEGTRVGIFLPMLLETVVAVLAIAQLRAVLTPIFSGYAAHAVAARLQAFRATHLITADGFRRRGQAITLKATADEALRDALSVERVIVVQRLGPAAGAPWSPGRDAWWHNIVADASPASDVAETDPEAPYMVIYTSGTTGAPKGTVHVHGGFPLKSAVDLAHTFDLRAGDTLFWFTDLGWMMGPWAIAGALLLGARLVVYEGGPDHPGPDRIWSIVARHRVTHLGVSPTLVRALIVHGEEPVRSHDLSSLRVLGSTGEPWNPDPWLWYFNVVGGGRLPIVNYSGGTEVAGGIVGCNVLRPIRPTSFNGPCIGMAVDVVDASGEPIRGDVGELVMRTPWPGMTRGFWGGDDERYLDTYWRRIPGLWVHGDWALLDDDGYWYLLGRSDDTLKVAGKRVGPAEVEAAAVAHPDVVEAAAIGIPDAIKGEVIVVLVVPRPGTRADAAFEAQVSALVVRDLGKTCRPAAVVPVPDLPRTRSGKIMRRVARAAFIEADRGDLSSLENAASVDAIAALATSRRPAASRS